MPSKSDPDPPAPARVTNPHAELVKGYPKFSGRMGLMPTAAMFRRFGSLNARNLLYYQAELIGLEQRLIHIEQQDSTNSTGRKAEYAVDYWYLMTSNRATSEGELRDGDTQQLDLVLHMRELLKEYNNALIQQHQIVGIKKPDSFDLVHIQDFLASTWMGGASLTGEDQDVWGDVRNPTIASNDLVSLRARQDVDSFSRLLGNKAMQWIGKCGCIRFTSFDKDYGTASLKDQKIFKVTFWITSVIASLIPVLSIVVLIYVKSLKARVGTIAAFNFLISACLTIFTDARRTDVFAVTAAFAAVQVVFVGQSVEEVQGVKPAVDAVFNTTCTC